MNKSFFFFILFFYSICVLCNSLTLKDYEIRDLESTTSNFSSEASLWVPSGNVTNQIYSLCDDVPLLGGFQILRGNSRFRRIYAVQPDHMSIHMTITFWLIDQWKYTDFIMLTISNGSRVTFNQQILKPNYNNNVTFTQNFCGKSTEADIVPLKVIVQAPHTGSKLNLDFNMGNFNTSDGSTTLWNEGFAGIRDVHILLSKTSLNSSYFCGITDPPNLFTQNNCPCQVRQYYNRLNQKCESCHESCSQCAGSSERDCSKCADGYIFDGAVCEKCDQSCQTCFGLGANECETCATGFAFDTNSLCVRIPTITTEKFCSIQLDLSNYLYPNGSCLRQCHAPMTSEEIDGVNYCQYPCADNEYYYVKEKKCEASCSAPNIILKPDDYSICDPVVAPVVKQPLSASAEMKNVTDTSITVGLVMMSAVNKGSQLGITVAVMSKMFQYIRYLNISYSTDLESALETWDSDVLNLKVGPDLPAEMRDFTIYKSVPAVFAKYGVHPSFLANYWDNFLFLLMVLSVFMTIVLTEWACKKIDKIQSLNPVLQRFRVAIQTFLLMLIYNSLGDIVLYSIIEYRCLEGDPNISKVSFAFSLLFILFDLVVLIWHCRILLQYQKLKRTGGQSAIEDLKKKYRTTQILYKDYKDQSFGQQAYLLFFITRDICFSLILTNLYEHPFVQTIILSIMNVFMFLYLTIKRPLKDTGDEVQQILIELCLLTVNVSIFVNAALDNQGDEGLGSRERIGSGVIIVNVIFNFIALSFMILKVIIATKEAYQAWKKFKQRKASAGAALQALSFVRPGINDLSNTVLDETNKSPSKLEKSQEKSFDRNQENRIPLPEMIRITPPIVQNNHQNEQQDHSMHVMELERTVLSPTFEANVSGVQVAEQFKDLNTSMFKDNGSLYPGESPRGIMRTSYFNNYTFHANPSKNNENDSLDEPMSKRRVMLASPYFRKPLSTKMANKDLDVPCIELTQDISINIEKPSTADMKIPTKEINEFNSTEIITNIQNPMKAKGITFMLMKNQASRVTRRNDENIDIENEILPSK